MRFTPISFMLEEAASGECATGVRPRGRDGGRACPSGMRQGLLRHSAAVKRTAKEGEPNGRNDGEGDDGGPPRQRFSAKRKLRAVSRLCGVNHWSSWHGSTAAQLSEWRDRALLAAEAALKERTGDDRVRGFDGHKRVKGRKRHILVDVLGLPLANRIEPANPVAGSKLLAGLTSFWPTIRMVIADAGHTSRKLAGQLRHDGWQLRVFERRQRVFAIAGLT